jgi:exopolyphosphatase/guanosine-5'-triphosphate,3'-diphosphate pyrophosphatase
VDQTLAALDVGTNSFHLVVARANGPASFEVIAREKLMIRLGEGPGDMKHLSAEAIERGVDALARMRRIAEISGAPMRAVATSAVREAENADEFIKAAWERAEVEVEVVSGIEEARLIHLGVLQALPVFDQRLLLCDIGGGSTELLVGHRGEVLASRSFKLGAVRLTSRFYRTDLDHPSAYAACRDFVRSTIAPLVREVERFGFEVAVGSSGTIEALAALVQAARGNQTPRSFNGFTFTRDALAAVVDRLRKAGSVSRRRDLAGMDPKRADIIMAGAVIFDQVVAECGIETVTISDYALREGVLLDTLQRTTGGTLHHLIDLSRRSVLSLVDAWDDNPVHARACARLAVTLFDELGPLHGLAVDAREYLEAATLLANVGQVVSHDKHHLHSYYLIRNCERLTGFTDHEVELIALVARYHRKSAPKASHAEFVRLSRADQRLVRVLAGIERVAIGLDRSQRGLVRSVTAQLGPEAIELQVEAEPGADIALELYASQERSGLLATMLERPIRCRAR